MNTNVNTKKLWDIPETMLVSLWCRATESQSKNPILVDKSAENASKWLITIFQSCEILKCQLLVVLSEPNL